MEKKKAAMMNLLKCNEEKKVTFRFNGELVELEILKSPCRNEFFVWLTTNKGQHNELSFPRVQLFKRGIKARRHCLGKDLQVFIPYSEMLTIQEANQED